MKKNGKSRDPEHVEATMQCWGCDVAGIFQSIYRLQRPHMWLWQAWRGLDKLLRVWIKEIRKFNSHLFIEATRMSEVDTYLIKSKRIAKKKVNTCVLFKQTTSIHGKHAAIFWILSSIVIPWIICVLNLTTKRKFPEAFSALVNKDTPLHCRGYTARY